MVYVYLRKREEESICLCVLYVLCLSVRMDVCLYILLSVPFSLSLASCLFLLSQSSFSPRPPIHQFTLRTPPISLTHHYFLLLPGSYIFRPLSTSRPPPFSLFSPIAWSWRPLSFYLSSHYLSQPLLCTPGSLTVVTGFFFPLSCSLSSISLRHLSLAFSYQLVSAVSLCVSMIHISSCISCLHDTFPATNLFMFSLVLQ